MNYDRPIVGISYRRPGLLYTGAMTLAHAYVHVSKTVKTKHGIYHKGVTHTKHGTVVHTGAMAY